MRAAEWIHIVVFTFFISLAWKRSLPGHRRAKVTWIGLVGLTANMAAAWLLPPVLPRLAASVVRDWLPAAMVLLVYWQAGEFFQRVDLGFQGRLEAFDYRTVRPLLAWLAKRRVGRWIAIWLELSYLFCYPMIPMSIGTLYVLHLARHSDEFWVVVLISTYLSYGMLPFLQTVPPRMLHEAWLRPLPHNPVREFNLWILRHASIHANTFPSAHVAASTAATLMLISLGPWQVGVVFAILAVGIALGTFMGRYHFAADAIVGSALAAVVFVATKVLARLLS